MTITLKTLPDATAQQVFDQVVTHLRKQQEKSMAPSGAVCAYRGEAGRVCAAGCLIGDDEYKPEFERNSWNSLAYGMDLPKTHSNLIQELQFIHDEDPVEKWEESLESLALQERLIYKPMEVVK